MADNRLSNNPPRVLCDPAFQPSGLLVLTTDESRTDHTHGGGRVATMLDGTGVKPGYQGTGTYDHRSLLRLTMTTLGTNEISNGAGSAPQMTEFFK